MYTIDGKQVLDLVNPGVSKWNSQPWHGVKILTKRLLGAVRGHEHNLHILLVLCKLFV